MKKLVLSSCLCLFALMITAQQQTVPAKAILDAAYKTATAENKNVLLIFHASWCSWCHKMDSSINNPSCKKFFTDNYVITHLVVHESTEKNSLKMLAQMMIC